MMEFENIGSVLIVTGGLLLFLGLIMIAGGKMPFGSLPGDISIEKGNFKFYAPITTFLIISIIVTVALNLISKA